MSAWIIWSETPKPRYVPDEPNAAIIARYARGRDYHKVMRGRLKTLSNIIREKIGDFESDDPLPTLPQCLKNP